ncbi:MAG: radical SAM protein [Candidatus Omnitrophica bacterium]|nr:radical SAM protein [Candidatus Omnitrophota bacterium]
METKEYKDFSWDFHAKLGHKPIVAQIELTYRCPLHCAHCYTDCYNNRESLKDEMMADQVKAILDKCQRAGVVWLCFTGGDPMMRYDFSELYLYAKSCGFIVSVFTSLAALTEDIFETFKQNPPFNIETTLNAGESASYKEITKTDFFQRQVDNIKRIKESGLDIRVKTQVTKQNVLEIDKIKELVERLGFEFRPSTILFARLNSDTAPCKLRLEPKDAIRVNKTYGFYDPETETPGVKSKIDDMAAESSDNLFSCAVGGHSFHVSVKGEMFLCSCLRNPNYDLLSKGATVNQGFFSLNQEVRAMRFNTDSLCRSCQYRLICKWCPGRAVLETGSMEEPIDYFCQLTQEFL